MEHVLAMHVVTVVEMASGEISAVPGEVIVETKSVAEAVGFVKQPLLKKAVVLAQVESAIIVPVALQISFLAQADSAKVVVPLEAVTVFPAKEAMALLVMEETLEVVLMSMNLVLLLPVEVAMRFVQ